MRVGKPPSRRMRAVSSKATFSKFQSLGRRLAGEARLQVEPLHRCDIGVAPIDGVVVGLRHVEIGRDVAGAAQIFGDQRNGLMVVGADERPFVVERRVDEDQRHFPGERFQPGVLRRLAQRRDDGAGDVQRGDRLDGAGLDLRAAVGAQHQRQISGFGRFRFDPLRQRHVERIGRVRHDQPDDLGAPAVQVDGKDVRAESRLLEDGLDPGAGFGAHRCRVLEELRHRRPRQADRPRELLHGSDFLRPHSEPFRSIDPHWRRSHNYLAAPHQIYNVMFEIDECQLRN